MKKVGSIVKYSNPQEGEADFRFILLEDNGDRVMIALIADMPFPPVETVPAYEITIVEGGKY